MKRESGFSVIEAIVAVALVSTIGLTIFTGLSFASRFSLNTDVRETAKNLAETQMEYIKGQPYLETYTPAPIPAEYVNYSATISAAPLQDLNIQKITVTIRLQGTAVLDLEGYKVK